MAFLVCVRVWEGGHLFIDINEKMNFNKTHSLAAHLELIHSLSQPNPNNNSVHFTNLKTEQAGDEACWMMDHSDGAEAKPLVHHRPIRVSFSSLNDYVHLLTIRLWYLAAPRSEMGLHSSNHSMHTGGGQSRGH